MEGTFVTQEWLEKTLQSVFNTSSSIEKCQSELTGVGRGAISKIIKLTLVWNPKSESLPERLVLKVPNRMKLGTIGDRFESEELKQKFKEAIEAVNVDQAHRCECAVYEMFRQNPIDIPLVRCYYTLDSEEGLLIFDDLSHGKTRVLEGFSLPQLMELAEHLATLHAFSLTNENWKNAGIEMGFCKLANSTFWLKLIRSSAKEFIDNWSDDLGSLTQRALDQVCVSTDDLEYVDRLHIEMDLPPVLCHGDLHVANMIFNDNDKFLAMLDWQVSHAGSIGEDFARLFTNSVPGELRRNHYMEVLNHYYETLTHKLGRKPPYSFEKLVENYKRCFKGAALIMVINMPMILTYGGKLESDILKEVLFRCKAMLEDTFEYEKLYKQ